jgi:hypothetical protein
MKFFWFKIKRIKKVLRKWLAVDHGNKGHSMEVLERKIVRMGWKGREGRKGNGIMVDVRGNGN